MRLMYKKCVNLKYSFILKGGVGRGPKEYVSDFVMKLFFFLSFKSEFSEGIPDLPLPHLSRSSNNWKDVDGSSGMRS